MYQEKFWLFNQENIDKYIFDDILKVVSIKGLNAYMRSAFFSVLDLTHTNSVKVCILIYGGMIILLLFKSESELIFTL